MQVIKFKTKTVQQVSVPNEETKQVDLVEVTINNDHTVLVNEIKGWVIQEVTAPLKDEDGNLKPTTEVNLVITLKDKVMDWQMVKEPKVVKTKDGSKIEYKEVLSKVEVNRIINLEGEEMESVLKQLAQL